MLRAERSRLRALLWTDLRGSGNLIEENHISHVMQVLHDGAAVYGNVRDSVIRGNVVRDVVPNGSGYGASGFYCDETSTDVIIEGNVTIGVPRPCHQHIARDIHVRGNTFITVQGLPRVLSY